MRFVIGAVLAAMLAAGAAYSQSVPVSFTLPADGEWAEVPDTALVGMIPTQAELGLPWCTETEACGANPLSVWTSASYDADARILYFLRPGGHADAGGALSYGLNLNTLDTAGWYRAEPVQHLTTATGQVDAGGNPVCPWPGYGAPSQHTYDSVAYLGNHRFLYSGNPGYCHSPNVMKPATMAWFVDTSTDPWTWTQEPQLTISSTSASAVFGQNLYLTTGAPKWSISDKDTGVVIRSGTRYWGVIKNGVEQPYLSGFNSAMAAAGINSDGLFCVGGQTYIDCSNVNGTRTGCVGTSNTAPTCNDDTFGRMIKRPVGVTVGANPASAALAAGYYSMSPLPDGRFAIWFGGKDLVLFKPGAGNDPSLDTWEEFHPSTGPTDGTSGRVYEKIFWDDTLGALIGYSNKSEGLWLFKVPGLPAAPPAVVEPLPPHVECPPATQPPPVAATEPPPVEPPPAQESGDFGPAADTSFAGLCGLPGTLLCDPLDDSPISGPFIKPTTKNLTMTAAIASRYGDWRAAWHKAGRTVPQLDPVMKAEGQGSLKFTIASQSDAGGASLYTVDLDPDHIATNGVGVGQTIRVRLKVRWSCDVLFTDCDPASPTYKQERRAYKVTAGAGGIKIFSIGEGDRGLAPADYMDSGEGIGGVVTGNYKQRGVYDGYVQVWYKGVSEPGALINGIRQFNIEPGGSHHCWINDPVTGRGLTEAWPDCHFLRADEWVTIQGELSYGGCTDNSKDPALASHWKLWVADEGQPFDLVMDAPINVRCGGMALPTSTFGKIWLTPYNTGKDMTEAHPVGYVWYDSLWVQRL